MPIIPWRPFRLNDPFEEMDKLLEVDFPQLLPTKGFIPTVDVYERENNLVVETPLAGVAPEDVEVSFDNGCLVLKGETKRKTEVDEKEFYRHEVRYGSFFRKIPLPAPVVQSKAEAVSEDGMLKVVMPKAAPAKKKKAVKVKVAKRK